MKNTTIYRSAVIFSILSLFILSADVFGQDSEATIHRDGYGSYDMMGYDPDEILSYGRDMMRYGFHEKGMTGGANKYPGYRRDLSDKTIKKLNTEQEAFIKMTQTLRQKIYKNELYLKAELVKKSPDAAIALGFQTSISETRGKFEQKMIEHLIRMKKINLEAE